MGEDVTAVLARNWPSMGNRAAEQQAAAEGPEPGVGPLAGPRWLYVWNRDPLGECCCWRGTRRVQDSDRGSVVGAPGDCTNPGKHPWVVRDGGELVGFAHGAADALAYGELAQRFGPVGGARQLAVVLDDVLVVDLDSPRALRDFARLSFTVPKSKVLGVSTSPRGYHVWLDAPGWNQKALNDAMAAWLEPSGGWSGTDEAVAGRKGFLLDVRTGSNRYVVWPGQHPARRWISFADFTEVIRGQLYGMPAWRMGPSDGKAPWAVDTDDPWIRGWIDSRTGGVEIEVGPLNFDGSDQELEFTWAELERRIDRLDTMGAKTGRNNTLNAVAYYAGSKAVMAGHGYQEVRERLVAAGTAVGTHGVGATVDSGLSSGIATLKKQQAAS